MNSKEINAIANGLRKTDKYFKWRHQVKDRDNYTCQNCKSKDRLHSHHIIYFYKLIKDYNITSVDAGLNCEILWDINNGQTLCLSCHQRTDSYKHKPKKKNKIKSKRKIKIKKCFLPYEKWVLKCNKKDKAKKNNKKEWLPKIKDLTTKFK